VRVPAGECTWNAAVSIFDKTITLQGAGSVTGGSRIIYGGSGHTLLELDPGDKTGKMDVSGFWFVGGDPDYWSGTAIWFSGPKGWETCASTIMFSKTISSGQSGGMPARTV
jgi:hypothetical protein